MKRIAPLFIFLFLLVSACDSDGLSVQFSGTDASLGSGAANLAVTPGAGTVSTGSINTGDIPDAADIDEVGLDPSSVTFSASGKRAQSGTVGVSIEANVNIPSMGLTWLPAYVGTITVESNLVTDIQPRESPLGEINEALLTSIYKTLPESDRPDASERDGLTAQDVADAINEALQSTTDLPYRILVANTSGSLQGTITFSTLEFGGSID